MVWAWRVGPANWIWMTEAGARGWWAGPGEDTSPTQLLSPAGGGTGHSLICSVTSDTRLSQPPWHHNTRPGPCQLGLPGPRPLWRQGQAPQDLGACQWPSEDRSWHHHWLGLGGGYRGWSGIGCLGVCQRCPHTLTGCGRASLPRTVRGSTCRGAQPNVTSIWAGERTWYLHRSAILWHNLKNLPVTINWTMFVRKSYNKLCVLLFQGHFPTKQSQCSDIRVSTSLHYEGGLHWDLKTWYLPYNKWWQPLRCD